MEDSGSTLPGQGGSHSNCQFPKVSVVVPFYNIENCVDYCLRSLLNQTYENYEIVCVDDGSTDGTNARITQYARKHDKIKLMGKNNGGLSDARNFGVRKSKGEYITFVDGDDLVSPYYLEILMRPIIAGRCDITIGHHKRLRAKDYPFLNIRWSAKGTYELMERREAIQRMLYGSPMISPWAHAAPRYIYEDHPFPVGKIYEDTLSFNNHVMPFKRYALCHDDIYGYVIRSGSITSVSEASSSRIIDLTNALGTMHASILNEEPRLADALAYHESIENCRMLVRARLSRRNKKDIELENSIVQALRARAPRVLQDTNVKLPNKIRIGLAAALPSLYCRAFGIVSRLMR